MRKTKSTKNKILKYKKGSLKKASKTLAEFFNGEIVELNLNLI